MKNGIAKKIVKFLVRPTSLIIIILVVTVVNFWSDNQQYKWESRYKQGIPDIELTNTLNYYPNPPHFYGTVKGFVKLHDQDEQPRGAKQYYIFEAGYDKYNNHQYTMNQVIKLGSLPPRELGEDLLQVIDDTPTSLIMSDEYGNVYEIIKSTKRIILPDAELITSESKFREYMQDRYKK